ncbi:MAG: Gfo/Idh/MocA family oxidoreductase [Gemmatimonadetes bacterium]|nr:Gfo/Idh/MocA family oxidoreductase [Gemmatimonadota bacterium]
MDSAKVPSGQAEASVNDDELLSRSRTPALSHSPPRLGFLGVGWIGRNRMEAIARTGVAEVAMLVDSSSEMLDAAAASVPDAQRADSLDDLLNADLDGIVIATPSALHAEQAIRALRAGVAVFCQKPLGRTAEEVRGVVAAARTADRLLGVDLSYRSTAVMRLLQELLRSGDIGEVFAANLVFHNAYGPDKPWFYDPRLSGGGCVMDLGIHLVDLSLWMLDFPTVEGVTSRLYAGGQSLGSTASQVEDYATARIDLSSGATIDVACSWNLSAGCDAVIDATFYGARGALRMRNVGGSFYDFVAERNRGTARETLLEPPDDWGGRAAAEWATRLAAGERFDPSSQELIVVAEVLDRIYGR